MFLGASEMVPSTPFYVFNADEFIDNYRELESAFQAYYSDYHIAYSFKTNYTPAVCKIVLELGGYAEVVSDMEFELAKKLGFPTKRIVYNGPGKENYVEECLIGGGLLNIDNNSEADKICHIAANNKSLSAGIRVNFDIGNDLHSRFGIDAQREDIYNIIGKLQRSGVSINGLHFHISRARNIEAWEKRINTILQIADKVEAFQNKYLEYIDLGSGMFGKMADELKNQFSSVPMYHEYAAVVAGKMASHYSSRKTKPKLFTEPGTTLVSKYFSLYTRVLDIKTIRNKDYALLDCSFQNVGEICKLKKVPIRIVEDAGYERDYEAIDFVGYTCLEQDVIYHNYKGKVGVGDIIEINNVGGYSIVNKPPFIHPDIPIFMDRNNRRVCVKRSQSMEDIFASYVF